MDTFIRFARYVLIGFIFASLIGLGWWYFTVRNKLATISSIDTARGAGIETPSAASIGSTYRNVISSIAGSFASETSTPKEQTSTSTPRLWHVSETPVAGFGFISGIPVTARFVERSSGYVLSADAMAQSVTRVTKTLVPRVYEAVVSSRGLIIERTFDNGVITTLVGSTTLPATDPGSYVSKGLSNNISSIAFSPSGSELAAVVPSVKGATGIRSNADGSKPSELFSSGIAGWRLRWLSDGRIVIVQNAADGVLGYAYEVGKGGTLSLLAQGPGLTALPRASSTEVLYGTSNGTLLLYVSKKGASTLALPLRTIADKCVWSPMPHTLLCAVPNTSPAGNYLDAWYRGEMHTSDQWWTIDAASGNAQTLYVPDVPLDVQDPQIDPSGSYVIFKNASDQSLWLLRVAP